MNKREQNHAERLAKELVRVASGLGPTSKVKGRDLKRAGLTCTVQVEGYNFTRVVLTSTGQDIWDGYLKAIHEVASKSEVAKSLPPLEVSTSVCLPESFEPELPV